MNIIELLFIIGLLWCIYMASVFVSKHFDDPLAVAGVVLSIVTVVGTWHRYAKRE